MGRRSLLLVVAIFIVAAIIAVQLGGPPSNAGPPATGATEANAVPNAPDSYRDEEGCSTGIYGHAIEVTIYGGSCDEWDRNQSSSGDFWRPIQLREETLVCSRSKGSTLIEVRDEGGSEYGTSICAGLTAKGWSETAGPGVEREEEHARIESEAKQQREQEEASERAQNAREAEREAHHQETEQHEAEAQQRRQEEDERASAAREQAEAEAEAS